MFLPGEDRLQIGNSSRDEFQLSDCDMIFADAKSLLFETGELPAGAVENDHVSQRGHVPWLCQTAGG